MAFQKQFKTSYVSYNGWEYYLEIWVNTTAGTITTSEIKLGTGGPVISYDTDNEDRFSPIISSNCVIPLVIESSVQENFVKQLREVYNERDVYVHLYKATEAQHSAVKPLWSGFVLMDLSSTPDEFYPYDFKITAVDGLGLLKDIDFVKPTTRRANEYLQTDMYYGPGRYTFWLKEILLKTGASTTTEGASEDYVFTTAINWYESQMPTITQSLDPFYITKCSVGMFHTKTDNGVFEVTNCYEVLKELLKHWGARMTYWKGQFWIVQIPQYITPDSGTYINPDNINTRTYDKTGSFISSSDNLGDSYYTRYQLNIGDLTGGIQKLTGTEVNYLPQIRETRANNISFGNGNRYGGFPREFTGNSAPSEIIFQDQINDASASDSFNLVIPLNVTVENGNPFFMKILFNFYCTDLTDTYYLQYNPTLTHKYYWVSSSQWTTLVNAPTWDSGFISPATGNSNQNQSHSNLEGFNQNILFKLYNTSTQAFSDLDLSGDFKFYLDIDAYGTNISNPGSFRFKLANAGLSTGQFFYPTHPSINVSWTNTLQSNYALQTPNIITNNAPNGNSIIQLTTPNIDPFEGMFVVITNTTGSIYGNTYVSSVNTSDVAIVDFGTLIWGDTLQISDLGSLQVYNGSTFVKSSSSGNWGNGILTGSLAFTQILLDEYLYGQTKVIESPSMRLVTSVLNRDSSDGSGLRPNYVNPIGRLKESRTNLSDVQYVFKRGAFYTLTDEWDYEGFEIRRDVSSVITTVKEITGPNNPVTGVGSVPKTTTVPNAFGQIISKQIITSTSSSVAAGAITSLPIALINDVVFKVGDFFNVLNSDTNEFIKFELNAQQFSDSSALTVVSKTITDNIPANSIITFNAFDLTSQYQNKTRGTVAGFDITATGIAKSSINITDWLNSDTMSGAAVTNVPTALSVKNYVDGQVGANDTLQEVTDNGNTTTNSIMIGSSSSPSLKLEVIGNYDATPVKFLRHATYGNIIRLGRNSVSETAHIGYPADATINFSTSGSEKMRLTSGGNLGLGTTAPATKLHIFGGVTRLENSGDKQLQFVGSGKNTFSIEHDTARFYFYNESTSAFLLSILNGGNVGINTANPTEKLHVVGDALITGDSHADAFKPASTGEPIKFKNFASTEVARITDGGNFGIGTSSPSSPLTVSGRVDFQNDLRLRGTDSASNEGVVRFFVDNNNKLFIDTANNGANLFAINSSGQVTIPATPIASTDAASKSYVDAHGGGLGPFLPLIGGTLTGNLLLGTTSAPVDLYLFGDTAGTSLTWSNSDDELQFSDNTKVTFGDSGDLQVYYDGVDGAIKSATGIQFLANSATKMTLTSGGNVGIGTTSPSKKLEIVDTGNNHQLVLTAASNMNSGIKFTDGVDADAGSIYYYHQDKRMRFFVNNSEAMNIISNGNLGLGTTSPSEKVTISGANTNTLKITRNDSETTYFTSLSNYYDASLGTALKAGIYNILTHGLGTGTAINFTNGNLKFNFRDVEKARITDGGNLLIGTTSDNGQKLQVNGGITLAGSLTGTTATFSGNLTVGNGGNGKIYFGSTSHFLGNIGANVYLVTSGQSIFDIGGSEKMRIKTNGNLGLGISSPSSILHISKAGGVVVKLGTSINTSEIEAREVGGGQSLILSASNSTDDIIIDDVGNTTLGGSLTGTTATFSNIITVDTMFASSDSTAILATASAGSVILRPNGAGSGTGAFTVGVSNTDISNNLRPTTNLGSSLGSSTKSFLYTYANFLQSAGILQLGAGGAEKARITAGGNLLLNTTTDSGAKLYVNGIIRTTGGSVQAGLNYGFTLEDTSNNNRYGLKFGAAGSVGGSNLLMLTNRSLSSATGGGEVAIGANASTTGVTETEVMRIKANTQSEVTIDGILSLTVQTTPADPSNNKSTIWLDSNWDLKIKITNSSGDTVTKTIVEYA